MKTSMPKWILASIAKHFNDHKGSLNLYVEGQKRNTNNLTDWVELRVNGPFRRELSKNDFRYEVLINVQIMSSCNDEDAYNYIKACGLVAGIFVPSISVFKFGDEANDDSSYVGCLQADGDVKTMQFGRQSPSEAMIVSQVQDGYSLEITIK